MVAAGTLALTGVIVVWALWLAGQDGASRAWKLVTLAIVPAVAVPLMLGGFVAQRVLHDVAMGVLFTAAVLVAIGTLMHAARAQEPVTRAEPEA
jgi:hypothetical protein